MASARRPQQPSSRYQDENGNPIALGEKLGEGGEGTAYLVQNQPNLVAKIWLPGKTPDDVDAKLGFMIRHRVEPELGAVWRITWPQHIVKENGVTVGYTMPLLDPSESWEAMVEYYNRLAARETEREQGRELRIDDRVRMARNLALGFRAVHAAGYVIGDVNEKNVEVNRQNDIAMVDCDSYGFSDPATGAQFSNNMGRPEFQAPEVQGGYENRTQEQDLFGLAVLIFHLLTGFHPYHVTNQPNHSQPGQRIDAWLFPPARRRVDTTDDYKARWRGLQPKQRELFMRCFDRRNRGKPRPKPEEWIEALAQAPGEWAAAPARPTSSTPGPTQGPNQTTQTPGPQQTAPPRTNPTTTQQQLRPPRLNPQTRPSPPPPRQPTQPAPSPPNAQQPPPTPPQPQPQPAPQARPSTFSRRAKLAIAGIGALVIAPLLIWLFTGDGDDTFETVANVNAGGVNAPVVAVAPTPTPRPTLSPTHTAIPLPTDAPTSTLPPPTPTNTVAPTVTPVPTTAPEPTATFIPTITVAPSPTLPPRPVGTPTPVQRLIQHPAHPKIINASDQTQILLQGCYLGNQAEARRFRLASWDVWDPSRYGDELKFVKIITNSGHRLPLEVGACYEATVIKQVNSTEEYVCLDRNSTHPQQAACSNYREHEVIPTFILYPDNPDQPNNFTESFVTISRPK